MGVGRNLAVGLAVGMWVEVAATQEAVQRHTIRHTHTAALALILPPEIAERVLIPIAF